VLGLNQIFILDHALKHILWSRPYCLSPCAVAPILHDVHVMPNGRLLLYVNENENHKAFSSLKEYDPIVKKNVWTYSATPPESFFSPVGGSAQVINHDEVLFSDLTQGGKVRRIDKLGHNLASFSLYNVDELTGLPVSFTGARAYDLSDFLANSADSGH